MAFSLILVRMTINLGQMAQVRVETSNAADAAALAGASWLASGQNEAALIAEKMWESIDMVQALYLVPFCPGTDGKVYAQALSSALMMRPRALPDLPDDASPGVVTEMRSRMRRYGVNRYLQDVADAAMLGGFMVGRREALASALNNMMMRFDSAAGDAPGEQSLRVDIMRQLEDVYQSRLNPINNATLTWDNGLKDGDPRHLRHEPRYVIEFSEDQPPELGTAFLLGRGPTFLQYLSSDEGPAGCEFAGIRFKGDLPGITNTEGPYPDLANVTLPANPLRVNEDGLKGWQELDLGAIIPSPAELTTGICSNVCGMQEDFVKFSIPWEIRRGSGTVTARIEHEVKADSEERDVGFPVWEPRFRKVVSEATASYSSARVDRPADPRASARLERTQ